MKKILYSSLLLSILQSILFWHKSPGISVIIFIVPTILLILYNLRENKMIKYKKGILWSIPILLLSLTYFIFNNEFFQILNVPVIFTLFIIMYTEITEEKLSENGFIRKVLKKALRPFVILFEFISDFDMDDFFEKQKNEQGNKVVILKKVGKSILISVPVIIITIILLSSADSVFGNLFSSVTRFISRTFESETISDFILRILVMVIYFIYIAGFIITFTKYNKTENIEEKVKKFNISNLTMNTLLISLNIVYLAFSVIQFKYLFMNAGKMADFNYATYARTGFFQLMFVSFINFALLKISQNVQKNELNKFLKILLIIFTIIIIISAAFRMYLYEQEYGYTYLRLFVYFTLVTEILILIPVLTKIFGQNLDVFKISMQIAITMYVLLNFINIDYIIARNNIDKYLSDPENNKIDTMYVTYCIGTDALNQKIRLLDASEKGLSQESQEYMKNVKNSIRYNINSYKKKYKNVKWQEFNLSKIGILAISDIDTSEN